MKFQKIRLELLTEFDAAPDWALFPQKTVAAILDCSEAKLERDRWAGTGLPFVKQARLVRYRKTDIRAHLEQLPLLRSTTEAGVQAAPCAVDTKTEKVTDTSALTGRRRRTPMRGIKK